LAGILVYTLFFIPEERAHPRVKTAAQAGKWAGLIILVIYVISLRNRTVALSFRPTNYQFALAPTVFAALGGFAVSWIFDVLRSTRFLGFLVLALVSATSITLYSYLFIRTDRNDLVFALLGFVLGVLLFEIFFPEGIPPSWARKLRGEGATDEQQFREPEREDREDLVRK
jgi:hypothetical protein